MTIALSKSYAGIASGAVVKLTSSIESALIAQGYAATSAAALTTGNQTMNLPVGCASIAAAGTSVTITNSLVDANTKIYAVIEQAAADTTALYVARVVPAAGSFTIYVNAAATAAVAISWAIVGETGVSVIH